MWLKAKRIDQLLAESKMTRAEFAREIECDLKYFNNICDGKTSAYRELARLIIAAFGASEMRKIIDWRKVAYECRG